ncbi:uncharacterized protein [Dendrobates tinctorius]|uniref:uncharacterized protein n=1 Tax=Dendrobates tinctorius TaxID=92724 RepID=UPI003CCA5D04
MDGWDNASQSDKKPFMNKVRTRWRSMKDRFNRDVRDEGQVRSGLAARTRRKYRYYRELAFLRPVLARRATWSSTLQPVSGAVLHRMTLDPSQPSDRQEAACRSATQTSGDQEAGMSGLPLSQGSTTGFAGTSRQRQRALDRNVMPEFMHLGMAFQNSLKVLSDRVESGFTLMERGFSNIDHRFHSVDSRLDGLQVDLNRPVHHFFNKTERAKAEHFSPDQQLNVMQACNTAYLQAMQQNQYVQQSVVSFPTLPLLTIFTTVPTSAAYHCMATCIPSQAGHHYTTTSQSAVGHSTTTTMASTAPVWSITTATRPPAWSTAPPSWSTATYSPARSTTTATGPPTWSTAPPSWSTTTYSPARSTATTSDPARSTATTSPPRSTATTPDPARSTATTPSSRSSATTPHSRSTTTEHQRGDPHSFFFDPRPTSTSSRQSSTVRWSHSAKRSRQETQGPKKKKAKDFVCPFPFSSCVSPCLQFQP